MTHHRKAGLIGGKVRAISSRKEALDRYYLHPKICKCCQKVIEVRDNESAAVTKKKDFCGHTCAAKYNNIRRPRKVKIVKIKDTSRFIVNKIKKNYFEERGYHVARSGIQANAREVYNKSGKDKKCKKCGYEKHFEVAHIKPVSFFSDVSLIGEINHIDNLVALCPTHHWEFDNGFLNIGELV